MTITTELTKEQYDEKLKAAEKRNQEKIEEINLKIKCPICNDYHKYSQEECFEKISIYPAILYIETTIPNFGTWSEPKAHYFSYYEDKEWIEKNTTESYRKERWDLFLNRDEKGRYQDYIRPLKRNLVSVYITIDEEEETRYQGHQVKIVLSLSDENIKKLNYTVTKGTGEYYTVPSKPEVQQEYLKATRPAKKFLIDTLFWLLSDPNEYWHFGDRPIANTKFVRKLNKEVFSNLHSYYYQVLEGFDTLYCRKRKFISSSHHDISNLNYAIEQSKKWVDVYESEEDEEELFLREIGESEEGFDYWHKCKKELNHKIGWDIFEDVLPLNHVLFEGKDLHVKHVEIGDDAHDSIMDSIAKDGTIAEIWRSIDSAHCNYITQFGGCGCSWIDEIYYEDGIIWYTTDCC